MNKITASVISIRTSSHLCGLSVAVDTDPFELILAETPAYKTGDTVTLVFKETEVILLKPPLQSTSANAQKGVIKIVEPGDILTSVALAYHESTIVSLVTTNAFKRLGVTIGDEVIWMVQPSEISLMRGHDGV